LLALSHFRADLDMWDPQLLDNLAVEREVIVVDNAGVGLSGGGVPETVEEMADHVAAFLASLAVTVVDLLGFSLGGYVAQELALRRPQLVRRVVLAGTAPPGTGSDHALTGRVHERVVREAIGPKDLLFLLFAPSHTSRTKGTEFIRRLGRRREDPDAGVTELAWQTQIRAARRWGEPVPGAAARLWRLPHPVFVAHGEHDVMVDVAKGRLLADLLSCADLKIYADAGHGFLFQEPDEFAADVHAFLSLQPPVT
jgi:pimeloyl-ACP methyl ester carboxylesterase